ncbi:hypothetical protein [Brazilian marseillevirus]|uniref:hypothetical protein n=1 Tax=Brazilian marseillevirus TaxID=1813599 RepID=UPI000783B345|nr:hypothetical protein A3303_gp142 [Brazilian marseillevirus]AMQ10650.1 hypothetical protein [Brazilian marseillevirus]
MKTFYLAVVQDDPSSYSPTLEPLSGKIYRTRWEAMQELEGFFKRAYDSGELPCENSGTWDIWTLKKAAFEEDNTPE